MTERPSLLRLRAKVLGLFIAIGVVVPAVGGWVLLPRYEKAIRLGEERQQQVLLSRVRQQVGGSADSVRRELELVASVVAEAARQENGQSAEVLLRAALASASAVDVVRFSVPDAGVNTVIAKEGVDENAVPDLTPTARAAADRTGHAYELIEKGQALVVAKVPASGGEAGYVAAVHQVGQLRHALREVVEQNAITGASVLVVSAQDRVVAGLEGDEDPVGMKASDFAAYRSQSALIDTTRELLVKGEPVLASQGVQRDLGWTLVVWRPTRVALAEYFQLRQWGAAVVMGLLCAVIALAVWASGALSRPILFIAEEAKKIGQRRFDDVSQGLSRADELGDLSQAVRQMALDLKTSEEEIKAEEQYRADLSRFLSQPLVDDILTGDNNLTLGGEHQEITVVFADMVAFSRAAETHSPAQVVALLNELFSVMTEVVFRHGGTVDKFIGDCIMGVWGAPVSHDDHAERAVRAARDMMRFLEAAAEEWYQEHGIEVRLAIGVNSGRAIVGNIGSQKRMEYTVVGDVVNVAARLETIAAPNQVLLSENTVEHLGAEFATRLLGQRELSGRQKSVGVYELELA